MFHIDFQPTIGVAPIAQEPMIFHCNHYNTYLQRTILDPEYINCRPILVDAATEVAYSQLIELAVNAEVSDTSQRLQLAADLYRYCGFGLLDFSEVTKTGGTVHSPMSHYSFAWKNKFGTAPEPMDFFGTGFIAAALAFAFDKPIGSFTAKQIACYAMNDAKNTYRITPEPREIKKSVRLGANPLTSAPPRIVESRIDEDVIVSTLAQVPFAGNEEGLMPAFGVILTRMYSNYYNRISFAFDMTLAEFTDGIDLGTPLLVEAGQNCAFNTFGGIMESDEWYGLVHPQCKNREDWVHGIVACVNAFGWGVWRIAELIPNERLVIRVYNGYEANGYKAMYEDKALSPRSFLATGGTAGIMNLLYHIDITQKPNLTPKFYSEAFSAQGSFQAVQTKCRAMGEEYDEFVAERY